MTILVKGWQFMNGQDHARNALALENPDSFQNKMNDLKGKCFDISHTSLGGQGANTYFEVKSWRQDKPAEVPKP